ncbi:MAG: Glutaconyl-CoA decarboxylase subunit beta [Lentisphaerae bacterium ADurb.BinA184]|nr:MAG: Glutaconyl-CoA decarboxylase subunit beta [Lentisphaerae bacterium ADurb.BinA184]
MSGRNRRILVQTVAGCALLVLVGAALAALDRQPSAAATPTAPATLAADLPAVLDPGADDDGTAATTTGDEFSFSRGLMNILRATGIRDFCHGDGWKSLVMVVVGFVLLYLGVARNFEPLLLVPIGFGTIFVNVPLAGMASEHGLLGMIFKHGIETEFLPLVVFIGIGALSDFGPLLASPRVAILGAAAQLGVFGTLLGVVALNALPGFDFTLKEACSIAIIGGADGPTSIYVASKFAPHLMGSIAVAAYSYMALVPLIQPPIMRLLTTRRERTIRMRQSRPVGRIEKILFPLLVLAVCILLLPSALPLMGCFAFGNFVKETGVVERLSKAMQNELMNVATIFLGLGVGMQMSAGRFLQTSTLGILLLGLLAFALGTAGGVIFAKLMNLFCKANPVNPLIGSAGVSAFPMAARVSNRLGLESDPHNFLLMHALGANVAGQIGSVVAAGIILAIFQVGG